MTDTFHPEPGGTLAELRDAATEYVEHGWPVQPGTYQVDGSRRWHGRIHADGLEPIEQPWTRAGITDVDVAKDMWTQHPYSILMACGQIADAIEIPATLGARITQPLRAAGCLPPAIASLFGTWLLLASPGEPVRLELAQHPGIGVLRAGTWIALPPTAHGHLSYRWRMHPRAVGWSVPSALAIQQVLVEAVAPAVRWPPNADTQGRPMGGDPAR